MSKIIQIIPTKERMFSVKRVSETKVAVHYVDYICLLDNGNIRALIPPINEFVRFWNNKEYNEELLDFGEYFNFKKMSKKDKITVTEYFNVHML